MIELRWKIKTILANGQKISITNEPRVLQYREYKSPTYVSPEYRTIKNWSEWQDVPEVEED